MTNTDHGKKQRLVGPIIAIALIATMILGGAATVVGIAVANLPHILTGIEILSAGLSGSVPEAETLEDKYFYAKALMEDEKYEDALFIFRALGDYRDSQYKVSECAYGAADKYLDRGDYKSALAYTDLMYETHRSPIFQRYYDEFCADEQAKADLYLAIELYHNASCSETMGREQIKALVASVNDLLQAYDSRHFYDLQLQKQLSDFRSAVMSLMPAVIDENTLVYLQSALQLHQIIDKLHADYQLLNKSPLLSAMSGACAELKEAIGQHIAGPVILESLATNFYELLQNTEELPYDPALDSYYLDVYNSTIYNYTLSYQISYYDQDRNLLQTSQPLTQYISGAYYTRVSLPIDSSFDWAYYDVTYQPKDIVIDVTRGPNYAVRLVDEQGNPIYNAHVSFRLGDRDNSHMSTTDRYGIARLYLYVQEENFRVYVNHNPDFIHQTKTYELQSDGKVHDLVVEEASPDFSVTVVDADGDPIPGVTMQLATSDIWSGSKYGKTDENGYVCWYRVDMSHTYKVTDIRLSGFVTIDEIHFEPENHHITVVLERQTPENDTPNYTVTVVDKAGDPIAGVRMYLTTSNVSSGAEYGKTDKEGNAYWYDVNLKYSYKVILIQKDGYAPIQEVLFEEGQYHMTIVLEEAAEEEETSPLQPVRPQGEALAGSVFHDSTAARRKKR